MVSGTAIDTLIRFSRMASEAATGNAILPLLADAAIAHVQAQAAVVVEIAEDGRLRVAAARNVPDEVASWVGDADAISSDLAPDILRASGARFERGVTLPLVSTGGLFGALVLLFGPGDVPSERDYELARGLVDLAAIAVGRAAQLAELARANAELRASRDALARTEKLRALGQMAAGVSHDLKNILNPLSLHLQVAQRAVARADTAQANASLEECKSIIKLGVQSLERLRAFSRQSPETRATPVDLNAAVREAVAIVRPRMSSRPGGLARIVQELGEAQTVIAREDEVVAAIVNLAANAIDAMASGGTITLVTGRCEQGAFVSVSDTGPGMTPEVQARVFEPFFTTKGAEGTGLGLAMVFATMQRYGGNVSLVTAPGKGATFTLYFPIPV
jgi:signal transduction histidine kinase